MTVTSAYRIKDVAERSGFAAGTLRYYERLGLLPPPRRTDAGYRVYDDAVLDRLAFIARAKELGCSLDEISALTVAWEGGRCGPLQDRLRTAVAEKMDDARRRTGELVALTAELQRAAAQLERHRPEGACDGECGCVSDGGEIVSTGSTSGLIGVELVSADSTSEGGAIACSLDADSMPGRLHDWNALLAHVVRREPLAAGVRVVFGPTVPTSEVMRLAVAEQGCCSFFAFDIRVDGDGVAMEVTAPPEGRDVVTALFGEAA
jgi:MerR family copper efflux transcriptional regulator